MDTHSILAAALFFLLGISIGSFLNVVIYRYGSGIFRHSRSKCFSCGRVLSAAMLIPLLSYVYQWGRCRYCNARISSQYLWVELLTGGMFVAIAFRWDLLVPATSGTNIFFAFIHMLTWSLLILISVYDIRHKIIPDLFSALFALLALVFLLASAGWGTLDDTSPLWAALLAGPLLALPFALLWLFSSGRWMGLGDAKLMVGIGWLLGITKGISAIVFSFWIALVPSLCLLLLGRMRYTMKSEIPFAPFLVLGALVVYLFGFDITTWVL